MRDNIERSDIKNNYKTHTHTQTQFGFMFQFILNDVPLRDILPTKFNNNNNTQINFIIDTN